MIKRFFDILLILLSLPISLPLLCIVAFMVKFKLGSPIFFVQVRPGINAKPFKMIKFRTMTEDRDGNGRLLSDSKRITRFGKLLRSLSLDELPEIWNVLRGEMSLVGPRPLLMEYLPLYTTDQFRRHDVRPGITGWAQVSGRNAISWETKFKYDIWYVDNQSILIDLKILLLTVKEVILTKNITAKNEATMPKFKGYKNG